MAIAANEIDEAKRITDKYKKLLPAGVDENFHYWNRCDIAFFEGEFEKARDYILKIPKPSSDFEYAKLSILQIKIYWELVEIEAGMNGIKTYRNWINKKTGRKLPQGSVIRYKAFLSVMYQFFRQKTKARYGEADWQSVQKLIEETNPLEKDWLMSSLGSNWDLAAPHM
jgi:hypothetical protein